MNVKTWNINLLKEKYKYYQKLLEKAKTLEEKKSLCKAIKSYESFIDDYYRTYKTPSFASIAKSDREFFDKSIQTIPILVNANNYIVSNGINLSEEMSSIRVQNDKILTVTKDFYHNIGGIFLKKYQEYYQNESIYINFLKPTSNNLGGNIVRPEGVNEAFININTFNGLYDIATSIHEHGHAIGASINENHLHNPFVNEIESIFFELVYLDTVDKNEYEFDEIKKAKTTSISLYHRHLKNIDCKYMTTLTGITDKKRTLEIIRKKYELDDEYVDNILLYPLNESLNYATSYLVAVELFLLYKRNSYAALKILEQIIRIESYDEEAILNTLKDLGITPGKSLKSFYKQFLNIKGTSKQLH